MLTVQGSSCFTFVSLNSTKDVNFDGNVENQGKSALIIFDKHPDMRGKLGRHFWARGYYVETVGDVNEEVIEEYIKNQEESDQILG